MDAAKRDLQASWGAEGGPTGEGGEIAKERKKKKPPKDNTGALQACRDQANADSIACVTAFEGDAIGISECMEAVAAAQTRCVWKALGAGSKAGTLSPA